HYGCPIYTPGDSCYKGNIRAKGTVTIQPDDHEQLKRCVIISTLIGKVRVGEEHEQPRNDKFCY
ncbi:MAG: prepilin-type cleavage/methylation domain-containing protein, partial [Kamptonema sp. SIO4C4]|nr:prepilin-type cleavage/methylation domain-containing protein [Kamptonema sp. SIO4C4]